MKAPSFDERLRYTLAETCQLLKCSRPTLRRQIKQGLVPVIREGRRIYVPGRSIAKRSQSPD